MAIQDPFFFCLLHAIKRELNDISDHLLNIESWPDNILWKLLQFCMGFVTGLNHCLLVYINIFLACSIHCFGSVWSHLLVLLFCIIGNLLTPWSHWMCRLLTLGHVFPMRLQSPLLASFLLILSSLNHLWHPLLLISFVLSEFIATDQFLHFRYLSHETIIDSNSFIKPFFVTLSVINRITSSGRCQVLMLT